MSKECTVIFASLLACLGCATTASYRDGLERKVPFFEMQSTDFAPVYPALAEQVVADYGITEGIGVDVGGGSGMLSIAMAEITDLTLYNLDIDPWALRLSDVLLDEGGLTGRIRTVEGDVQDLPFRDEFADLVVSRGSIFFWPDQLAGLLECHRILKPGGVAIIGGGFPRSLDPAIRAPLVEAAQERFFGDSPTLGGWRPIEDDLVQRAKDAGISEIRLIEDPTVGWWIELRRIFRPQ